MPSIPNHAKKTETQKPEVKLLNFLTIAELVTATKISRQTISRKIKSGEIPQNLLFYLDLGKKLILL